MKTPIWYKDRQGEWQVIPQVILEAMETFEDGEQGIRFLHISELMEKLDDFTVINFWQILKWEVKPQRYVFK